MGKIEISYVEKTVPDTSGAVVKWSRRRLIYFALEWLSEVARAVAIGMDEECAGRNVDAFENAGVAIPALWWSEG